MNVIDTIYSWSVVHWIELLYVWFCICTTTISIIVDIIEKIRKGVKRSGRRSDICSPGNNSNNNYFIHVPVVFNESEE